VLPGSGNARIDREGSEMLGISIKLSMEYEEFDERRNIVVRGLK
jgi:hypothetical protein